MFSEPFRDICLQFFFKVKSTLLVFLTIVAPFNTYNKGIYIDELSIPQIRERKA